MTIFRPCIDLHAGQVKQIVGGTLRDENTQSGHLKTNYVSTHSAAHYAELYRTHKLHGGHVIMLGPDNEQAARCALQAWPQSLQIGGGISDANALQWVVDGAEKVIVTSFLFPDGKFSQSRLERCLTALGNDRTKLVIDLSCRRHGETWYVATNKWQTMTSFEICAGILNVSVHVTCQTLLTCFSECQKAGKLLQRVSHSCRGQRGPPKRH